ncbi:MAG: sigma factor-like helix-turn-helix DNA-binding protein, partial [Betaproteobacteria bacterium]
HVLSLDAPLDGDSGYTIADGIADDEARAPEILLHDSAIEALVAGWLGELSARQRLVVERRYGFNGCEVATLEELAKELEVTRERVRQIQAESLNRLRAELTRRGYTRDALF